MMPTIKEGETSRVFDGIQTLETPLQSSGTCKWVPEDETRLTTKNVTQNGVYRAVDEGAYGYSSVTVNVSGADGITGTGSDGKQHTISTDPTTGQVVDTIAPVEIRVTTPPTYTGPYGQGAYISFTGIVVHAYDSDGVDMGAIPFDELIFPVTVAQYDASSLAGRAVIDSQAVTITQPVLVSPSVICNEYSLDRWEEAEYTSPGLMVLIEYSDYPGMAALYSFAKADDNDSIYRNGSLIGAVDTSGTTLVSGLSWKAHSGSTLWFTIDGDYCKVDTGSIYTPDIASGSTALTQIATALFDGTITYSGDMQIPVQWQRPGDYDVLETNFYITVVPGPSGDDD